MNAALLLKSAEERTKRNLQTGTTQQRSAAEKVSDWMLIYTAARDRTQRSTAAAEEQDRGAESDRTRAALQPLSLRSPSVCLRLTLISVALHFVRCFLPSVPVILFVVLPKRRHANSKKNKKTLRLPKLRRRTETTNNDKEQKHTTTMHTDQRAKDYSD